MYCSPHSLVYSKRASSELLVASRGLRRVKDWRLGWGAEWGTDNAEEESGRKRVD